MDLGDFKTLAESVQAWVTSLALIIGGGWALRRYVFQKEGLPRLDFRVDVRFVGMQRGVWIVELLGLLENKGAVPHRITDIRFDLRCLSAEESPVEGDLAIQRQVRFRQLLKEGSWTPGDSAGGMVILPQVSLRYSHIAQVPPDCSFVLLHGRLHYARGAIESLRADAVASVPTSAEELRALQGRALHSGEPHGGPGPAPRSAEPGRRSTQGEP